MHGMCVVPGRKGIYMVSEFQFTALLDRVARCRRKNACTRLHGKVCKKLPPPETLRYEDVFRAVLPPGNRWQRMACKTACCGACQVGSTGSSAVVCVCFCQQKQRLWRRKSNVRIYGACVTSPLTFVGSVQSGVELTRSRKHGHQVGDVEHTIAEVGREVV